MQEKQFSRAPFAPETLDLEARTVEVIFSKGAKVLRNSFKGPYFEELSLDPSHLDLSRLNSGAAVLDSHNGSRLKDQIGVVQRAYIVPEKNEARATIRFSKRDEADKIFQDVADGILTSVSVGYEITSVEERSTANDTHPTLFVKGWRPYEISFVPIPADEGAKVRSYTNPIKKEEKEMKQDENSLPVELERDRVREIFRLSRIFNIAAEDADLFINDGTPLDQVRKKVISDLAESSKKKTDQYNYFFGS